MAPRPGHTAGPISTRDGRRTCFPRIRKYHLGLDDEVLCLGVETLKNVFLGEGANRRFKPNL